MPNCGIAANSISRTAVALTDTTSAVVASAIVTVGALSLQQSPINPAALPRQFSLTSPARIGAPVVADPYARTLTHASLTTGMPATGNCTSAINGNSQIYQAANCIIPSPGLLITAGQTIDLAPGTYWAIGDLTVPPTGMLYCSACDNVKGRGKLHAKYDA